MTPVPGPRRLSLRAALLGALLLPLSPCPAGAAAPAGTGAAERSPTALERCRFYQAPGAVDACREAVRQAPDSIDAKRGLARSLIDIGDFDGVVNVYAEIAAARPDDPQALADLGGALGFVRRYQEAIVPMAKVLLLRPDDIVARRAVAVMYTRLGRADEAFRVTLDAARLGDPISMFDLVRLYRDGIGVAADPDEALAWAERAAESGHLGALELMVRVYLNGLLGQATDEAKAKEWAWKSRDRRRDGAD